MALNLPVQQHRQQQHHLHQQQQLQWVEITEQPMGKNLRFRYISEGRTAGSIEGERSTTEHRTYPSIKIHNYSGPATAVVSCMTADEPHRPHPHHLVGNNCKDGVCIVQIPSSCQDPIPFSKIGIQCCTRKDIARNLDERKGMHIDPLQNANLPLSIDTIDLTTVSLCFQVFIGISPNVIQLTPVISQPIVDKKVCSELAICRLSRISGSVHGGDEVFLFCSKIKKENIKVIFSNSLANGEFWEKEGIFSSTDVHKQYAIVFKTPSYHTSEIRGPTDVSLYLMRPSDNAVGEPKTFTFYPENPDPHGIHAKRKRIESNPSSYVFLPPSRAIGNESLASVVSGLQPTTSQNFRFPVRNVPSFLPPAPGSIPMFGLPHQQQQQQRTNAAMRQPLIGGGGHLRFDSTPRRLTSGIPATVEDVDVGDARYSVSPFTTIDVPRLRASTSTSSSSLANLVGGGSSSSQTSRMSVAPPQQQRQQKRHPQNVNDFVATTSDVVARTSAGDSIPTTLEDYAALIGDFDVSEIDFGSLGDSEVLQGLFDDPTVPDDEFLKNLFPDPNDCFNLLTR